jgi:hypothetical protein
MKVVTANERISLSMFNWHVTTFLSFNSISRLKSLLKRFLTTQHLLKHT